MVCFRVSHANHETPFLAPPHQQAMLCRTPLGMSFRSSAYRLRYSGRPAEGESLESWRDRLRPQHAAECDGTHEPQEVYAPPPGLTPFSREKGGTEHSFRALVADFPRLEELTRDCSGNTLEEVKRLIQPPARGSFPTSSKLIDEDKGRELDRLVAIAKALHEMAVSAAR